MRRMILAGMSVGLLALTACGSDDDVDEMDDVDVSIPMVTDPLSDPTVPPTIDPAMSPTDTVAPEMDTPAPMDTSMDSPSP